ncbi:MAG: acyl-CoA thioesterase [Anaerolineales bacterium]
MNIELDFVIRTYEIDFGGHVSNIVYIRWLEDLRLEMLNRSLPLGDILARGRVPVLLSTQIDYLAQPHLPQTVRGRMWTTKLQRSRAFLGAEFTIAETGEVAARATQSFCVLDRASGRPVRLPDELRAFMDDL